jgi:outer membrane protein TolC
MNKTRSIAYGLLCAVQLALPSILPAQTAEPITLKQAAGLALENSHEVALARAQYRVAVNATGVSRSAFRPNLYTGSGAAFTYGFPQTPSGAAPSIINLSYVQTVFNPVLRGQTLEATERAEIQRLEMEKTRSAVVLQTTSAYLELATVRQSLDLTRQQRQSATRLVDYMQQRAKEGQELPLAVKQAELAVANVELRLRQLEGRQQNLERQLTFLEVAPFNSIRRPSRLTKRRANRI